LEAGYVSKNKPTLSGDDQALKYGPKLHGGGKRRDDATSLPQQIPIRTPMAPPITAMVEIRLELQKNVTAPRAEGFADADFAGTFGDVTSMMS